MATSHSLELEMRSGGPDFNYHLASDNWPSWAEQPVVLVREPWQLLRHNLNVSLIPAPLATGLELARSGRGRLLLAPDAALAEARTETELAND